MSEMESAIAKVENGIGKHLSIDIARAIADKIRSRLDSGMKYVEALRYSLNDLHFYGEKREDYKKVMGVFFGRRGGRTAARNAKRRARRGGVPMRTQQKVPAPPPLRTWPMNKKGQYQLL